MQGKVRCSIQKERLTWIVRAQRAVPHEARWVFNRALIWRARFYVRTTGGAVRGRYLRAGVCRRFLCFVSFSPLEKEMKCRHAQWPIALSKKLRHQTCESESGTLKTKPRPQTALPSKSFTCVEICAPVTP
jgi:hypothetical protein